MNIFSNLGITELVLILLLALLVVGPERLPELARKLGTTLRDLRRAYDNLTKDLGPELASFQETAKELRESVDAVRTIPKDMVQTVVKSAELDGTLDELKDVRDTMGQVGQTLSDAKKVVSNPLDAAKDSARKALSPDKPAAAEEPPGEESKKAESGAEPVAEEEPAVVSLEAAEEPGVDESDKTPAAREDMGTEDSDMAVGSAPEATVAVVAELQQEEEVTPAVEQQEPLPDKDQDASLERVDD
jgi:sec-independent protein translocase protein TatB